MNFIQTRPASRRYFPDHAPSHPERQEWVQRGANFVVVFNQCDAGDVLPRDNAEEYIAYLPDCAAVVAAGDDRLQVEAGSVVTIPPGPGSITVAGAGKVLRVFSASAARDLAAMAGNADVYAAGAPEVAPANPWGVPDGGVKLRAYRLDDYRDRPMRMFRTSNLMINIFDFAGPRDTEALSPHSHDDFEQGSFGMTGEWVHSLRYPWSKSLSSWREDEHLEIGSPSLLVIPATVIHTSRSVAEGNNQLVDIFCPPRVDFVEKGWVCNEAEYPPPPAVQP